MANYLFVSLNTFRKSIPGYLIKFVSNKNVTDASKSCLDICDNDYAVIARNIVMGLGEIISHVISHICTPKSLVGISYMVIRMVYLVFSGNPKFWFNIRMTLFDNGNPSSAILCNICSSDNGHDKWTDMPHPSLSVKLYHLISAITMHNARHIISRVRCFDCQSIFFRTKWYCLYWA